MTLAMFGGANIRIPRATGCCQRWSAGWSGDERVADTLRRDYLYSGLADIAMPWRTHQALSPRSGLCVLTRVGRARAEDAESLLGG